MRTQIEGYIVGDHGLEFKLDITKIPEGKQDEVRLVIQDHMSQLGLLLGKMFNQHKTIIHKSMGADRKMRDVGEA